MSDQLTFDSNEERHMSWWLDELKSAGYVKQYGRAQTFTLAGPTKRTVAGKKAPINISPSVEYTPDFIVYWDAAMAEGLFVLDLKSTGISGQPGPRFWGTKFAESIRTYVEVKGSTNRADPILDLKTREAKLRMAWLWKELGIYTNLVTIDNREKSLFDRTFMPIRYNYCDRINQPRKLKFRPRVLADYVAATPKLQTQLELT